MRSTIHSSQLGILESRFGHMIKKQHPFLSILFLILLVGCAKTQEQEIPVDSISLSQPTAEMIIGETAQLSATVLPSNATDKTVQWTSSKQSVATVTSSGLVTAIAEGTSTVTASAGGKSATCLVTISKGFVAVTSIAINKTELVLAKGHSETLTATVKPDDATDKTVVWDISKTAIATVDSNGKVTAIAGGDATITAKAGNLVATCTLTVTVPVESVFLDKESISLDEDSSTSLVATVKPDDATDKSVTWSSSNANIATVDQSGKVTAVKEGHATITAKAGDMKATCSVTVKKKFIAVTSITLNKTELSLNKGHSETLKATVKPDNATDKSVTWSSTNTTVATVDSNGKVTAVAGGNTTITAKAGNQVAKCALTVTVPVESVSLDKESITLEEDSSTTLVATVKPDDATDKSVVWNSSNTSIATVDQSGKVMAVKEGSATITAKAGDKKATCSVTVKKKFIAVNSITLNKTELSLNKGHSETLKATVKPDNATDKSVTWSSTNSAVATVDSNGKVTAVAGGNATITAKAGDQQATCAVTVSVPLESISLNKNELALNKGQSETLTATIKPDDATDKTVTWFSSNTGVATVDSNGKVTAIGGGNATITAKAGDKQATCSVTVTVPVESITLNKTSLSLIIGESSTINATVNPNDATDKTLTWSSSQTSVATVDQNGKVTAISIGNSIITVKAGNIEATCSVSVKEKDLKGPVVESLTFSPETVDVSNSSQDVKITVHVTDESGVNDAKLPNVFIYLSGNYDATRQFKRVTLESGTAKDGVYSVTFTIPQGKQPGEWTIECYPFYDLYDNNSTGGSHKPTSSKKTLTVINTTSTDLKGPVVESLTFSPETVDVSNSSQDVKITVHVTDESGVNDAKLPNVFIYLSGNYDATRQFKRVTLESGTAKDGVYSVTFTIPQGKQPGEWTIECYPFYDLYDNNSTGGSHKPTGSKKTLTVISN